MYPIHFFQTWLIQEVVYQHPQNCATNGRTRHSCRRQFSQVENHLKRLRWCLHSLKLVRTIKINARAHHHPQSTNHIPIPSPSWGYMFDFTMKVELSTNSQRGKEIRLKTQNCRRTTQNSSNQKENALVIRMRFTKQKLALEMIPPPYKSYKVLKTSM